MEDKKIKLIEAGVALNIKKRCKLDRYLCHCGKEFVAIRYQVTSGKSKSCGCLQREWAKRKKKYGCLTKDQAFRLSNKGYKHGHTINGKNSRTFVSWSAMKARCTNPKNNNYIYWGARGIKVCERWLKFENFLADMGIRPEGTSLDRINVNGNYEPGNCRWATNKEQANNKRNTRPKTSEIIQ